MTMTDVFVPYGNSASDTAVLLLAEAEDHEGGVDVVRTTSRGFLVPEEIAKDAGVDYLSEGEEVDTRAGKRVSAKPEIDVTDEDLKQVAADDDVEETRDPQAKPAAKTPAKKTAAKKTAAKSKE